MKVQLFARARDLAGSAAIEIDLPADRTVADLRRALAARYPHLAGLLERSAFAIADEFAGEDAVIGPDAIVALLPPVSGGC
jgi:molybdopterin converting factor small subunit